MPSAGPGRLVSVMLLGLARTLFVCLRIVPVVVKGKGQDNEIVINALLDPGSDVTLCNVSLMKKLGLEGRPKELSLATVNGTSEIRKGFEFSLTIRGLQMNEDVELNRVWTVDTLCLPQSVVPTKVDTAKWPHLNGIEFPRIQANDSLAVTSRKPIGCMTRGVSDDVNPMPCVLH